MASFCKAHRKITPMDLDYRHMFGKMPWNMIVERRGDQEILWLFKDYFFQSQEQTSSLCGRSSKGGKSCMDERDSCDKAH